MTNEEILHLNNIKIPLDIILHGQRVAILAYSISIELKLKAQEKQDILIASLLHDIGKICIPDEIINKPDKLTADEYEEVKKHAYYSSEMLKLYEPYKKYCDIVLYHHEWEDGTGYYGLIGKSIPVHSKIIALCDYYDALTSDRIYRSAYTKSAALEIIQMNISKFDSRVVRAFNKVLRDRSTNICFSKVSAFWIT